ncbi:MAG: CRISPR-associated endonuclease Cas1 [Actinomycetota bacterium]
MGTIDSNPAQQASDSDDVPELVPARMLNEFTYCPRLFFLEWVQARFADNPDTVEGRFVHRAVDKESGRAPLPDEGELRAARSVHVSSLTHGLVARIDLVEGDAGAVRPVETKKGHPPDNPEQSWEPERIQLCVHGLLLRDAGYRCEEGVLYFAEVRKRVRVVFDDALIQRTIGLLQSLREVAARDLPPPPLVDSPKCPRCSLVGICLPDETNALAARSAKVRKLLPSEPAARPVYVTEQGAMAGKKGGRLEVWRKDELLLTTRLIDVSQLCIYGNAQVTTQLLRELFAREVPICWFSYGNWFCGIAEGLPSKHVELRRKQVALAHQGGLDIARRLVKGKIANCRTILRRNSRDRPTGVLEDLAELAREAEEARSIASLLGIEGAAARSYFSAFETMLGTSGDLGGRPFRFEGRNRRPPRDPINCLLSLVYALLVKELSATLYAVGFDPYLGFLHRPRFGRPALALDMAEEFRPLIGDSTVLTLINNGEIKPSDFISRSGGVALTGDGRRSVLKAYERRLDAEVRHPVFGYRVSYRRILEVQARVLGAHLLGEIPEYAAFVTR